MKKAERRAAGMKKMTAPPRRGSSSLCGPSVRIPLPSKGGKRHGDATKYARARQKELLRRELESEPRPHRN